VSRLAVVFEHQLGYPLHVKPPESRPAWMVLPDPDAQGEFLGPSAWDFVLDRHGLDTITFVTSAYGYDVMVVSFLLSDGADLARWLQHYHVPASAHVYSSPEVFAEYVRAHEDIAAVLDSDIERGKLFGDRGNPDPHTLATRIQSGL
jgi:hypothetical protein